jgi:hypothetical protein
MVFSCVDAFTGHAWRQVTPGQHLSAARVQKIKIKIRAEIAFRHFNLDRTEIVPPCSRAATAPRGKN